MLALLLVVFRFDKNLIADLKRKSAGLITKQDYDGLAQQVVMKSEKYELGELTTELRCGYQKRDEADRF